MIGTEEGSISFCEKFLLLDSLLPVNVQSFAVDMKPILLFFLGGLYFVYAVRFPNNAFVTEVLS